MTTWYTLACIGLCSLVVLLYGVLRYINRTQAREAKQDREDQALYDAEATSKAQMTTTQPLPDVPPPPPRPPRRSQHHKPNVDGHEYATRSMFHTVGRISLMDHDVAPHQQPPLPGMLKSEVTHRDSASIFIMEDSGDIWDVDGDDDVDPSAYNGRGTANTSKSTCTF
ncbi:hypothetical protein AaE_012542 [Aphanomyces astaci]|uniref:Uncharacterized protein n=1 Tax=Aphanomyces astaci TaxID=112090 RepID=A0A6A4ZBS5_APHAT|nr:hypothetical protein AaE_012542 [Aphanomyces astaci]